MLQVSLVTRLTTVGPGTIDLLPSICIYLMLNTSVRSTSLHSLILLLRLHDHILTYIHARVVSI